jgi:hypothetical protein
LNERYKEDRLTLIVNDKTKAKQFDTYFRIRHRKFGVLLTISNLDSQAYQEIIEDEHPIMIITRVDIVEILRNLGINNLNHLITWSKKY